MSAEDRLKDAELLWAAGRRKGALLSIMVAVAASARRAHPGLKDRDAFVTFLKSRHAWTISVESRRVLWDLDALFYQWLRCELAHEAGLPVDIRIDDSLGGLEVRAGGPPTYLVSISPDWFNHLAYAVRSVP
ncbi:MAG: hypothetical protein ABSB75_02725 [Candidatus Limnocylindrales bacterium]